MNDNSVNLDQEVSFTYPDGFNEAAKCLEGYPDDEQKIQALLNLIRAMHSM